MCKETASSATWKATRRPTGRKEIYYRYWTNHAIRPAHFAIRSDRYKLIFYYARNLDMTDTENFDFTPSWDFYDLQNDPHENHNAYNDRNMHLVTNR